MGKVTQRLISVLIICGFLLGAVPAFAAGEAQVDENDLALLTALQIIDEQKSLDEIATRADLAYVGVGLLNRRGQFTAEQVGAIYSDVSDVQYAADIYGAYLSGLMLGDGTGKFNPDAPILIDEISIVMLRVAGYGEMLSDPVRQAQELNLFRNVNFSGNMKLADLYKIAVNCLNTKVMIMEGFNPNPVFSVSESTVLNEYFNVYKGSGVIMANSTSALISAALKTPQDIVEIDGVEYEIGDTDAYALFGVYCDFYYIDDESSGIRRLVSVTKSPKSYMVTIDAMHIESYGENCLEYTEEGKSTTSRAKISKTADIIYNGTAASDFDDSLFIPELGEVTLIDNDSNGTYDVVFIYSYKNYIVSSVNLNDNIIYDTEMNQSIALGDTEGQDFVVYINNKLSTITEIQTESVASVFESMDGYKLVYVNKETLSGVIERVEPSNELVSIDGMEYIVCSKGLLEEIGAHIGKSALFYIDGTGKVAYADFNRVESGVYYGFLMDVKFLDDNEYEEQTLQVKIFKEDGSAQKFMTGPRFRLNDETVRLDKQGYDYSALWVEDAPDSRKLIQYTVTDDGEIKEIHTAVDTSYNDVALNGKTVVTGFRRPFVANEAHTLIYKLAGSHFVDLNSSLGAPITVEPDGSTVVFVIPEDPKADESYYSVSSISRFENDENVAFDAFRTTKSKKIDYIVVRGQEERAVDQQKTIVVKNVTQVVNEFDEVIYQIEGCVNGVQDQVVKVADDTYRDPNTGKTIYEQVAELRGGDYIMYGQNTKNELTYFEKLFDAETMTAVRPGSIGLNTPRAIYGMITGYTDGIVTIREDATGVEQSYKFASNVLVHDTKRNGQTVGSNMELVYGRRLCLYIQEERAKEAVIYE